MTYKLWTRYEPIMVEVTVATTKSLPVFVKAYDASQANTVFYETEKTVNGQEKFYVRLPLCPDTLSIKVFNKINGDKPVGGDDSIKVVSIKKKDLKITLAETKMDTPLVRNFIAFAQKFAYNAGWIKTDKVYSSSWGNFKIEYLPYIKKLGTGEKMATPARISTKNGLIQVSQEAFINMTIPMRMAILFHEFSHYYVNSDVSNEVEADLNGLTIYLGLGYPVKEGMNAFAETFEGYATQQNKQRFDIINKFVKDYVAEHRIEDVYATGPQK